MSANRYEAVALDTRQFDAGLGASGLRTLTRLAEAAGLSRSTVYVLRRGMVPSEETQQKIAKTMKVPAEKLWRRVQL